MNVWNYLESPLWALFAVCLPLLPLCVVAFLTYLHVKRGFPRNSPLTRDLLRAPGQSLRDKIHGLQMDLMFGMLMAMVLGPMSYTMHISLSYFGRKPETLTRTLLSVCSGVVVIFFSYRHLRRTATELRIAQLGLDGEVAVAQELDQLMLDGCRVFHDVPYRYGNIDHVVVSRSGVYTINTKMRGKPDALKNADVTVDYTAGMLRFPDADFPIPISGPETEARWLSRELSEATGENIQVEPMLAFPGWYFKERIGRGSVFVFNPTRPQKFFLRDKVTISPQMIQRIAYQLERLVRHVPPMLKDESQKW